MIIPTNLGLIGTGQWGQKYIDTISANHDIKLTAVCRKSIQPPVNIPSDCHFYTDWEAMLDMIWRTKVCDGVIIATPPDSHIPIAAAALERGIGVMIEKPLALTTDEIEPLLELQFCAPILVNHIHLFSSAYQVLKNQIHDPVTALQTTGCGNGPFRKYSSLHDYGSHDIAMCIDLMGKAPEKATATRIKTEIGEIFNIILRFGSVPAVIRVGNGAPEKRRLFQVFCGKDIYEYNDLKPSKFSINGEPMKVGKRTPLSKAIDAFVSSLQGDMDPRCGLTTAIRVAQTLDACVESIGA